MLIKDQTLVVNCKSISIKGVFFIAKVEGYLGMESQRPCLLHTQTKTHTFVPGQTAMAKLCEIYWGPNLPIFPDVSRY